MEYRKCVACKNTKVLDDQNFSKKKNGYSKTCIGCLNKRRVDYASSVKDKENVRVNESGVPSSDAPDNDPDGQGFEGLGIIEFDAFLDALSGSEEEVVDCVALVRLPKNIVDKLDDLRLQADAVAHRIWDAYKYRFVYQSKYVRKRDGGTRFMYHCAQSDRRQHQPQKDDDEKKWRDKGKMTTFACKGWLHITLSEVDSLARIKIGHSEEHVPYFSIDVPADIQEFVVANASLSVIELWNKILEKCPLPNFSRRSIYQLWYEQNSKQWTRDPDELKSATLLINEAAALNGSSKALYCPEVIPLPQVEGFTALAFCMPEVLRKWGGQIREWSLDSAWNTNKSSYEVFALLGEVYGSGCPVGYLLLKSSGDGLAGGKELYLTSLLTHFKDKWNARALFTLTDKDLSEINACRSVFPEAKHQLCFWHCLRAIKTRLAILRRRPKYYDVLEAHLEFDWIDKKFLPMAQRKRTLADGTIIQVAPDIPVAQKAIPKLTVILNGELQSGAPLPSPVPNSSSRRLVLRLNGVVRSVCKLPSDIDFDQTVAEEVDGEEDTHNGNDDNLETRVDRFYDKEGGDTDQEDGPDWMFDEGETLAKDPEYTFCPAPHRRQLLHIFTKHFCQHPLFPERTKQKDGKWDASRIRANAVYEMYTFCKARGLADVWGYMWANWYSPKMWPLWARSTSPLISRLRTTMNVENFWRQLKHDYLHRMVRPRLDTLVWVLIHRVTPSYFARGEILHDTYRLGRSKALSTYQTYFKKSWKEYKNARVSGKKYDTNVKNWTCNCGRQKYDRHHLCKHLVHAVPFPPPDFWGRVARRRTTPIYQDPCLVQECGDKGSGVYGAVDGSVSDGDDHVWLGDKSVLEGRGGWQDLLSSSTSSCETSLGKRKRSPNDEGDASDRNGTPPTFEVIDLTSSSPPPELPSTSSSSPSRSPIDYGSGDEQEEDDLVRILFETADALVRGAELMRAQANHPNRNRGWMKSVVRRGIGKDVVSMVEDIDRHVETARNREPTWPKNNGKGEKRRVANTMGFQV